MWAVLGQPDSIGIEDEDAVLIERGLSDGADSSDGSEWERSVVWRGGGFGWPESG
jgi:hypothetical protein